jgi:hypothetical protein
MTLCRHLNNHDLRGHYSIGGSDLHVRERKHEFSEKRTAQHARQVKSGIQHEKDLSLRVEDRVCQRSAR